MKTKIFESRSLFSTINFLWVILFFGVIFAFQPAVATESGGISGQVTDKQGGILSYVDVVIYEADPDGTGLRVVGYSYTDNSGNYTFSGLVAGDYYLNFSINYYPTSFSQGYPEEVPFDDSGVGTKTAISVTTGQVTSSPSHKS